MKQLITAEDVLLVDRLSSERFDTPVSLLMENAGKALAQKALSLAGPEGRFLIFCGPGNNGGDGFVAARKLAETGRTIVFETVGPLSKHSEEARQNLQVLENNGVFASKISPHLDVTPQDVILDALLGIGLSRPPDEAMAHAIETINGLRAQGAKVLSADIPSGLQSDTGIPYSPCVRADVTVAFGAMKVGHAMEPGASLCGDVHVADIGIPKAAWAALPKAATFLLEESDVCELIPRRRNDAHKGTAGHVLVVAGSRGKSGAAALTARGALRAGAGLVTVASKSNVLSDILAHAPEVMGVELSSGKDLSKADLEFILEASVGKQCLVIGPGIPKSAETGRMLGELFQQLAVPCVIDADALNALADSMHVLQSAACPLVLTPHPGEMARLMNCSTSDVQKNRILAARTLASQKQVTVVLKGARTVIALPDGRAFVNPTGNAGMATAGSGDVLSGVCGALLASGMSVVDAACVGVFAHGLSGDLSVQQTGMLGLLATDLIEGLKDVWIRWQR